MDGLVNERVRVHPVARDEKQVALGVWLGTKQGTSSVAVFDSRARTRRRDASPKQPPP